MEEVVDSLNSAIESYIVIVDSLGAEVEKYKNNSDINSTNMLRTFLSSGTIILVFIIERILTYRSTKGLKKIEFFHDIVVKPNVSRIVDFFSNFYTELTSAISEVRNAEGTGDQIDQLKDEKLDKLKDLKIKFDHEFLSLVRSANSNKANSLTHVLNSLEDIATTSFTNQPLSSLDLPELERNIHVIKADFFEALNNNQKQTIKKSIKMFFSKIIAAIPNSI